MIHHLINEEQVFERCLYCGKRLNLNEWKSGFYLRKHYKQVTCACGKENKMTIRFEGSGHDSWLGKHLKEKSLDEKIK